VHSLGGVFGAVGDVLDRLGANLVELRAVEAERVEEGEVIVGDAVVGVEGARRRRGVGEEASASGAGVVVPDGAHLNDVAHRAAVERGQRE